MQKSIFLLLIATLAFTFGGCKKDPENQVFITEDNVAAYVAGNIARDMRGLVSETEDAARWASHGVNDTNACSYVKDSTFSQNNATGSTPSFSFAQSYHTDIKCTGSIATVVHFSLTHNGLWEATTAKANGNGSGAWNITDLNPLLTDFKINGDYSRSGNAVDKKGGNLSFSSDLRIKLKDVLVNKNTKILQGGTMTFTLTGASSTATDYDISGTVTILSSTSAKITINTKNYTIDLTTGAVS